MLFPTEAEYKEASLLMLQNLHGCTVATVVKSDV